MFGRSRIETKTPDQILRMRKAGLVVGQTLQLMAQTVRPGMTTKALDELAEEHIRGCGATPSFLGYHGFTGSLCTSVNEEVVHGIPGSRVLTEGDLISIDCGAIVDGWHGDAAISVIVGGRDAGRPQDLALIDATEDSMWAGIAALSVGESLYAVGAGVEDSIVASGDRDGHDYGIVEEYVGHGIGTEMHMDPQVPNYRVRDRGPTVRSGVTVAIEPMVTLGSAETRVLRDDWTVVTTDQSRAAHWENTVAVTDDGLWVLTALDGGKERLEAAGAAYAPLS
ncbi:type I methionyl aminopeptidase [Pedococcus bigeumensis]|uniref:Methionine aminopeptidase n=1 Tax=Pedococcus bigeumensis TaxID=433644 RepID=A0A502CKU9_9MICO|nr:type I methionyl aminopeptidase [Pedococcus bigeumensis]TPG13372.1 type I methionyl aminopeptidase [Pedococcus bigeumensis]